MVVSRFSNAFFVDQDYIYFLDLTFRHYGVGDCCPKALYFYNASNNLVQGCTFAMNNLGIGIKYASHRNLIQDNLFYDDLFAWPWDSFYEGEVPYGSGGLRFYEPADGRGTVIRRNTFHDFFDGFGACPESTGAVTNETDVYDNLVYNSGDDGMETDGRCSNLRIWGNTFHDVLMGISLAPVYDGPVYAIRNLIYRTGAGNNDYSGSAFKFNSGYDQSGPMILFHNTGDAALTDPLSSGLDIKSPGSWTSITARNNIWSGTEYALSNANPDQALDLDYDDLYTAQPGELAWWSGLPDRHLNTLAELQAATGQEQHGMNALPGFTEAAAGGYTLAEGSPLVDAALLIPGINDDFVGAGPDIGAFESQGYGFSLRAAPSTQTIQPGGTVAYVLSLQTLGGFNGTVDLSASSPSPDLIVSLEAEKATPPAQVTLTVTDTHSAPLPSGLWYTIPVTATSGELSESLDLYLLVGGTQVYLPLARK
jgi:parallel beta-helix repeat protein